MKKITFHLFDIGQNGGVRVLFIIGNLLKNRGYDVEYLVASGEKRMPFPSNCTFRFPAKPLKSFYSRIKWLSRETYFSDVVIATLHPTAFSVNYNKSRAVKKIYYIQAYEPQFYTDNAIKLLFKLPYYLSAVFSYKLPLIKVVNCSGSKKGLSGPEAEKAIEIPAGIDPAVYYPRKKNPGILTVGHISRKETWKGSRDFFRAMKILQKRYTINVQVAYDLCEKTCGVNYQKVFPKTDLELADFYSSCDVVVSTVWQKGFPYPPLETMACGSLSVSTPIDYGSPMHDHIPIKIKSPDSIVEAIEYAMNNRDIAHQISINGLNTAKKYYWHTVVDQWVDLIEA